MAAAAPYGCACPCFTLSRFRQEDSLAERRLKTLERVLSKAGLGSRTDARSWIGSGRVSVNGRVMQNPDHWVDLDADSVAFDGKPLERKKPVYVLLYKPTGYVTSWGDPDGRPTVYDLIRDVGTWVSPVGRLDLDTSGLLLLTNDTEFSDRVMSPAGKISKKYLVKTNSHLADTALERLRHGVELNDGPTAPAEVRRVRDNASSTFLEITIQEGRNRQVRRMIEAVGSRVRKLVRTAIGRIQIGDLPIGSWRQLTEDEINSLGGPGQLNSLARPAPSAKKSPAGVRSGAKGSAKNRRRQLR